MVPDWSDLLASCCLHSAPSNKTLIVCIEYRHSQMLLYSEPFAGMPACQVLCMCSIAGTNAKPITMSLASWAVLSDNVISYDLAYREIEGGVWCMLNCAIVAIPSGTTILPLVRFAWWYLLQFAKRGLNPNFYKLCSPGWNAVNQHVYRWTLKHAYADSSETMPCLACISIDVWHSDTQLSWKEYKSKTKSRWFWLPDLDLLITRVQLT